ncbi:MAG: M20/M25/M40 family metallo-hydrolase [Calditrichota bacterium]
MPLEQLAVDLINIPSITGSENAVLSYLEEFGKSHQLLVRRLPVIENRYNILLSHTPEPSILFCTHCDTVPPFIDARIENGKVYGRGSCDAKGILATMLHTLLELPEEHAKHTGLLVVVGEETDSIGAKSLSPEILNADFIILGEPTENQLVSAQKGCCIFELNASGIAAHSGYPEQGSSAVNLLLEQLELLSRENWGQNTILGKSSFNIGTISGGEAANMVPSSATASCSIRLVDDSIKTVDRLQQLLLPHIDLSIKTASNPVHLYVPEGYDSIVVGYGSDASYLQKLAPVILCGPGSILQAHRPDEHIRISDLYTAQERYKTLTANLLTSINKGA